MTMDHANDYKFEKFKTVCQSVPLTAEFASSCTSAVALLARTVSTLQMINELYTVIGKEKDKEIYENEDAEREMFEKIVAIVENLESHKAIALLAKINVAITFDQYLNRLETDQKLH